MIKFSQTEKLRFRPITEHELREFWRIRNEYIGKIAFRELLADWAKNRQLYVGCYLGQQLIGIAYGSIKDHTAVLEGIAVKHHFWKKGIGRQLLAFFEKRARRAGIKKITVGAANFPTDVTGFYAKAGYRTVEKRARYTVMEKELD